LDKIERAANNRLIEFGPDSAEDIEAEEGIRQGMEDARKGMTRPARLFFAEFEAAHSGLR
jgi:hypothetical protein